MFTIVETPTFTADAAHLSLLQSRGVWVIYFSRIASGELWLLVIYAKSVRGNIPAYLLKSIREAIEND